VTPAALHLSPHPDDELIGAPATLMALRDAGWRVVNLACGLGSAGDPGREAELRAACTAAGFELRLPESDLRRQVGAAIEELRPAVVLSPGPRDRHPAHLGVAALAREAIEASTGAAPRWWAWAVWGWLEQPNLASSFSRVRLEEVLAALEEHRGQLDRNDYRRLVRGRAEAAASLAPELLFGFGSIAPGVELAELLTELAWSGGAWQLGAARWLDPASPLSEPTDVEANGLAHPAVAGDADA
jgi:LmbE family N-acetylglucosaminyl deacetylase